MLGPGDRRELAVARAPQGRLELMGQQLPALTAHSHRDLHPPALPGHSLQPTQAGAQSSSGCSTHGQRSLAGLRAGAVAEEGSGEVRGFSTAYLGSMVQGLTILTGKRLCLLFKHHFPCSGLNLLPLVSLALSLLHQPFRCSRTLIRSP